MENNTFVADVVDISFEGYGVVKDSEGKVFFVDGAIPGEKAELSIIKQNKKYGYARVKSLLVESKSRVEPPCPYHGFSETKCGGCSWMYIDYSKQLELKESILKGLFAKKKIAYDKEIEVVPSDKTLGYRGRARFYTEDGKVGFLAKNTKNLVPIKKCLALEGSLNRTLEQISASPKFKSSKLSFVETDKDSSTKTLQLNQHVSFSQANSQQNSKMLEWLKNDLSFIEQGSSVKNILELFCGSGNFTKILAEILPESQIHAVEMDKAATATLEKKKLKNTKVYTKDIYNYVQLAKTLVDVKADLVFLDPPRAGFKNLADTLKLVGSPKHVYYISCNADSYCNDIKPLLDNGYTLETVKILDMFPNTPHIELLTKLTKL